MGTVEGFKTYMENLASMLKLIGHTVDEKRFANYSLSTLASQIKLDLDLHKFCLVMIKPEGRFRRNRSGQTKLIYETGFYVIKNKKNDGEIESIQLAAETLCHKLWAKILNDWDANNPLLIGLITDRVEFPYVSEMSDGSAFGCECGFSLMAKFDRSQLIQPEDWN